MTEQIPLLALNGGVIRIEITISVLLLRKYNYNTNFILSNMDSNSQKNALVTGGNKGIGLQICRDLAKNNFKVILTARNEERGMKAKELLKTEGLAVDFHLLDVVDENSIQNLSSYISNTYGRLDVLINNAAIYFDGNPAEATKEQITSTLDANLVAPWMLFQSMLPLLQKSNSGRIINLSSGAGELASTATEWAAYSISKLGLNALTRMLAKDHPEISFNAVDPGWVRTDMGGYEATRSVEEGADTIVWLSSLAQPPTGKFFLDREEKDW